MKLYLILFFLLIVFILILITSIIQIIVSRKQKRLADEVTQLKKLNAAVSGINIR